MVEVIRVSSRALSGDILTTVSEQQRCCCSFLSTPLPPLVPPYRDRCRANLARTRHITRYDPLLSAQNIFFHIPKVVHVRTPDVFSRQFYRQGLQFTLFFLSTSLPLGRQRVSRGGKASLHTAKGMYAARAKRVLSCLCHSLACAHLACLFGASAQYLSIFFLLHERLFSAIPRPPPAGFLDRSTAHTSSHGR